MSIYDRTENNACWLSLLKVFFKTLISIHATLIVSDTPTLCFLPTTSLEVVKHLLVLNSYILFLLCATALPTLSKALHFIKLVRTVSS